MAKYRLSRRADNDLAEIADYSIGEFGIEQARRYRDALEACFLVPADNPLIGHSAEQFAPRLRQFDHASHIVFYLPDDVDLLIVRILHEHADIPSHLSE